VTLAVQISFLAVWMAEKTDPPSAGVTYILTGLSAFAMGMQMNAIRLLHVSGISTTAATATFIDLVSGLVTRSLKAREAVRLAAVLGCLQPVPCWETGCSATRTAMRRSHQCW
jgi:uncharacterized membrane protein YoaK (UPF0700 family)